MISVLVSCQDFLEEEPKNFISPTTFYNNFEECEIALNGCYDLMHNRSLQEGNYYAAYKLPAIMTDEMQWFFRSRAPMKDVATCQYSSASETIYLYWSNTYRIINWANGVIVGIENAPITQEQKNGLIGQAKFIRALFYSHLVNQFGDVPLLLKPTTSITGNNVPRNPASEVFEAIIADLKFAEANLPPIQAQTGRIEKGAAQTMLVKVYMQMAGYPYNNPNTMQLAADKAVEIINNKATYGYELLSDFSAVFDIDNDNNAESIFEIQYIQGAEEGSTLTDFFFGVAGTAEFGGSRSSVYLVREFHESYQPGDLRRDWTVADFRIVSNGGIRPQNNPDRYKNAKYRKKAPVNFGPSESPKNFIVLRYADVLLMAAEALSEVNGGPTPEAYEYLNRVRRRAYGFDILTPNPTSDLAGLTKESFLTAMVDERSWELAGEGFRWYDLKRWKLLVDRVRATTQDAAASIEEKHYFHPVPLNEIEVNSNLLPQNVGWE